MNRFTAMGLFLAASLSSSLHASDPITLKNVGPAATDVPLCVEAPTLDVGLYVLMPAGEGRDQVGMYAEVVREGDKKLARMISADLKGGTTRLSPNKSDVEVSPAIEMVAEGKNLQIRINDKPFTTYRVDSGPKPILCPMLGVDGLAYTRSFPMEAVAGEDTDHPHQRSFWFTYGLVNGVDFWSEVKGHGSIKETSRTIEGSGHVFKSLKTTDDWLDAAGKKLMEDRRVLTFWATRTRRVIDVDVTFKATEGDVEFGDTKEGMFGVRVPSSMDAKRKAGGAILNAEGVRDAAAWGKKSAWVDYSGPVGGGKTVGLTIMEHPASYGHPSPWHVRDYGLFAVNPFGKHNFGLTKTPTPTKLARGETLTFKYRVILHQGDAESAQIQPQYEAFAHPPAIGVK